MRHLPNAAMDGKVMIKCVVYTVFGMTLTAYDFAAARVRRISSGQPHYARRSPERELMPVQRFL